MQERPITTKILPSALRLLRLIAAETDDKQYIVMSRLFAAEAKRLGIAGVDRPLQPKIGDGA